MTKTVFRVTGTFRTEHKVNRFSKEFVAPDEAAARELTYSTFGSKHGLARRLIKIEGVEPVAPENVESSVVRFKAGISE